MMSNAELPLNLRKAIEIIQNAVGENGSMRAGDFGRIQAEMSNLGVPIIMACSEAEDDSPARDEHGRTFFEVSIHPFVKQIADENGEPVDGEWFNPCTGDLSGFPDAMFRKEWSVSSWVQEDEDDEDGEIDAVDDEAFPDYDTAIVRAEALADQYGVEIDHRY